MRPAAYPSVSLKICAAMLAAWWLTARPASAWDEEGHAVVAETAFAKLPANMPDWLRSPEVHSRLIYLSSEPDRWRGQHSDQLDSLNNPDHYFDIEEMDQYGLTMKTLPLFRREFLDLLATQRAQHPDRFPPRDRAKDTSYTQLVPGLLPYRIAEVQWLLASSWTTLKTYEQNPSLVNDDLIRNARENVVFHMGILSHYVGDGAQPLHVSIHHHGWHGANPKGYTTEKGFHQLIDGGLIAQFEITPNSLRPQALAPKKIPNKEYWPEICGYLEETHKSLEPLYELEKSGELRKAEGKRFIEDRLLAGGAMLAGVWIAAYDAAVIDDFRVNQLKAKKQKALEARPQGQSPTSRPAGSPAESGAVPVGGG